MVSNLEKMIFNTSHFYIQKLALAPLTGVYTTSELLSHLPQLSSNEKEQLFYILYSNYLGPLWIESLKSEQLDCVLSDKQILTLKNQYTQITQYYIQNLIVLGNVTNILDNNNICHAVFKGAHTREHVYEKPNVRYSVDIDILIEEKDRSDTISVLVENEFNLHENIDNITHELSLTKKNVNIDLHWHLMRPGRVPKSLTASLLQGRIQQDNYWSLCDEDNIFILLTHPFFTKYMAFTQTGLIRMVDLVYWINKREIEWAKVEHRLSDAGFKSAAWISLQYLKMLCDVELPLDFSDKLSPSKIKQWYLEKWISSDLASQYKNHPLIPKLFFTLLGHDSLNDVFYFGKTLLADKLKSTYPPVK